jgi:AAA+ ATPase superfamily predicted ATPase
MEKMVGNRMTIDPPKTWLAAFRQLILVMEAMKTVDRKRILFFDELPWLAGRKSGFLAALGFFWNNWASKNNIIIVICGSAASWMIQKVVHHKGGLHNRITRRIHLQPFTLAETEQFFHAKNIHLNRYQIAQIYMTMGGIPHYLKEVENGKSAVQTIDDLYFSQNGILRDEFTKLYPALFEQEERHIAIIRALAKKWKGLTRSEIITATKLPEGGNTSKVLQELIYSGFVNAYYPFGKKKKSKLYRLTDEYSLFYLHFIENKRTQEKGIWTKLSQTATYSSWSGYSFENLCLKHIPQIKKALQIGGVYTESSSFYYKGDEDRNGVQIDLLIDRNDQVINLCELKFYRDQYRIDKQEAAALRARLNTFMEVSKTKKQVFLTFITSFGLLPNQHSLGLVDQHFSMDILFETVQ